MNKTILTFIAAACLSFAAIAQHHGPGFGPAPHHGHHHHSAWGHGGANFWPGFAGGLIAGTVFGHTPPPPPPPVVVHPAPVVVQQPPVVVHPAPIAAQPQVIVVPQQSVPVVQPVVVR